MPVEPPVVSPYSLREALRAARRAAAPARSPAARTCSSSSPASWVRRRSASSTCGRSTSCAASRIRRRVRSSSARSPPTRTSAAPPICREHLPALVEAAATIGAAQIQHRGTIGGNVMNASPPATCCRSCWRWTRRSWWAASRGEREIPAAEFWPAYRRTAARPGRAAAPGPDHARDGPRAAVPEGRHAPGAGDLEGRRGGGVARVRTRGGTCGSRSGPSPRRRSGSARPRRRSRAGRATSTTVDAAVDALGSAIQPIDDVRSTAAYRREAARRVVRRLLADSLETT